VSNEALCVLNGITPIHIKIEEISRSYEITKGTDNQYDREIESDNWTHPAMYINTIEGDEESVHPIQAYTDGSK